MVLAATRQMSQLKFVAVHHSGVPGIPADVDALKRRLASHEKWHCQKNYPTTDGKLGYTCLLYHAAIAGDGSVVYTQDIKWERWQATDNWRGAESANRWGMGVLLEGEFGVDVPTPQQLQAAADVIYGWNVRLGRRLIVKSHQEFAGSAYPTPCAGKNIGLSTNPNSNLSAIIERVASLHTPPLSDLALRRKTIMEIQAILTYQRDFHSHPIVKDEWRRILEKADIRATNLA